MAETCWPDHRFEHFCCCRCARASPGQQSCPPVISYRPSSQQRPARDITILCALLIAPPCLRGDARPVLEWSFSLTPMKRSFAAGLTLWRICLASCEFLWILPAGAEHRLVALMIHPWVPVSAFAAQAADIAGQGGGRAILGIGNVLLEYARGVRVNSDLAMATSRRVADVVDVVTQELECADETDVLGEEAFRNFTAATEEIQLALREQSQRSYLAQLLHQRRFADALAAGSERFKDAFNILQIRMKIQNTATTISLSTQIEKITERVIPALSERTSPFPAEHLPPRPQVLFGRYRETRAMVDTIVAEPSAHVAILGGPGMGKTTLAVAVLHDAAVAKHYDSLRFFVPCDAAEGKSSCLHVIAQAFGIMALDRKVIFQRLKEALGEGNRALIVLDNFESAWEASEQRGEAEDVLRFFDALPNVSLILTLRGAERPQGVRWSRPFFPPLGPLDKTAALQTFFTIAAVNDSDTSATSLLELLDNIPLAVVLMANLAQSEPAESLLQRWEQTRTAILVRGSSAHRLESLDISISLSVNSPRIRAVPSAITILSVLSLLPHGAVETDLQLWGVADSMLSASALLQSSLTTRTTKGRLYVLAPIREHMLAYHPPSESELAPVYRHYFSLAEHASQSAHFAFDATVFTAIVPELANIDSVIRYALSHGTTEHVAAVKSVISLCILYAQNAVGPGPALMPLALSTAREKGLDELCGDLLLQWGRISFNTAVPGDPSSLYSEARILYERTGNVDGIINASLLMTRLLPVQDAIFEAERLFSLSQSRGDVARQARAAHELAIALRRAGRSREAIEQHELAIRLLQPGNSERPDYIVGLSKYQIGELHMALGDLTSAILMYEAAIPDLTAAAFSYGVSIVRTQLAQCLLLRGNISGAIEYATLGLAVNAASGFRSYVRCLLILAHAHALSGHDELSTTLIERVDRMRRTGNLSAHQESECLQTRGNLALARGDLAEARILLDAAHARIRKPDVVHRRESMMQVEASILQTMGEVLHADQPDDAGDALVLFVTALVHYRKTARVIGISSCLASLAGTVDDPFAMQLIEAVMPQLKRMDLRPVLAKVHVRLAELFRVRGDRSGALTHARTGLDYFGEITVDHCVARAVELAQES